MKRLLGNNVDVFLKLDNDIVSGVLFDIEDECVYVQTDVDVFIAIPKENIKYYVGSSSSPELKVLNNTTEREVNKPVVNALDVYVDQP